MRNTAPRLSIGTGGSLRVNPLFVVSGRMSRPPSDNPSSQASTGRVAPALTLDHISSLERQDRAVPTDDVDIGI